MTGDRRLRGGRGERNGKAVLSDADVAWIRQLYAEGAVTYTHLAQVFNTPRDTIASIIQKRRRDSL